MKYSLRTKLSVSYVLVALLVVIIISLLTNLLLEKQFKSYVILQQEQRTKETVNFISQQYKEDINGWDEADIESIGMSALAQGIVVKLKDASEQMVWDATVHNNGLCSVMLDHMAQNMLSHYPDFKGGYVEARYPVIRNFIQIGTVDIGYYGPYYFTDNDLAFISTLNKLLMGVGVFVLFFALLLGTFMAKRLSVPISKVIASARQISKGYYGDRILQGSSTKEIGQLTTTINELAETLEKQDALRKRLTADVAHELRTPLATLQSHMEALIDGIWKPERDKLISCHEEILRMNRMIADLENLARVENGNVILDKSLFDISKLIQKMIVQFETDFMKKNIKVNFVGKELMVFADMDKMNQVLINLLSNALKYLPQGGSINISVMESEKSVEIRVQDDGVGISADDLPYIFERFYRVDQSRNRSTGGSGIGLTIARAIVEAHKGTIAVVSEIEKGAEFIVTLPK